LKKLTRRPLSPLALLAVGALAVAVAAAGCGGSSNKSTTTSAGGGGGGGGGGGKIQVCVLLPDTTSSVRYELFDRPYLASAFKAANIKFSILNALGDAQKQRSQGDQCLTNGAKVVLLDALDSGTGAAIEKAVDAKGGKSIDYDRLVLNGKASYYVSFDNVVVGKTMGKGLVDALKANGKYSQKPVISRLDGGITDNNATLFKQGYDSVLDPLFKNGTFVEAKSGDQFTDWDAQKAATIFEQMLAANNNKIDGSIAANDNLAGAVVSVLKSHKLKPIPLTGQDATPQGVQNILSGWQSGTVYKAVKEEADAAAKVAIDIIKGNTVKTNATADNKVRKVPSVFLKPIWITKKNYTILFKDKYLKKSQVCTGQYAKYCK
jgi:D-xylose transport system substrate-binding protein